LTTLFLCPELQAVNSTSAFSDKTFLLAVDAPDCRKKTAKIASVEITSEGAVKDSVFGETSGMTRV
jgi:hypothetical protein